MPTKQIISEHRKSMDKAIEYLRNELKGVRTGRASTGLVENLRVEYYGNPTPLNQMATIAVPSPDSIIIKPFDPSSLADIEKAIRNSDLSLAPIAEGKVVRLSIPPLSTERRQQIVTQIKQLGEQSKVSIRNIRRDAMKQLEDEEKDSVITEDDREKGKKEVDSMTKEYTEEIDKIIKGKSEEIMSD